MAVLLSAGLAGAALVWVGVLVAAPALPLALAAPVYLFGSFICHQIAERSFHVDGVQLPVCGRCFGIYAGAAVGALMGAWMTMRSSESADRVARWGRSGLRPLLVAVAIPTLATLFFEWLAVWHLTNAVRALAGSILGAGVAFAVIAAIHYEQWQRRRPIAPPPSTPM